jgi:hypothetical protein
VSNYINDLAKEIHQYNVDAGWWDGDREIETALMLVVSEIAEATEGERKDLMDDHLPTRKMGEVELADALIRMLDIGGRLWLKYDRTGEGEAGVGNKSVFKKHLHITKYITDCTEPLLSYSLYEGLVCHYSNLLKKELQQRYSLVIDSIYLTGEHMGYDIDAAMHEKLEYNKTRPDHKPENRAKDGGKKV